MRIHPLLFSLPLFAAIGCGVNSTTGATADSVAAAGMQGKMFGGQQPIVGATVTVYAMSANGYGATATVLGTPVTTDGSGNFTYGSYTCPANNPPVYIVGTGGNAGAGVNSAIALAAGIGPCSTAPSVYVNVNEVTTAATAFALSHFFTTTLGTSSTDSFGGAASAQEGNNSGLVMANNYTIPLLVNIASGIANGSTATITTESAKLNSIANTLAACVNSNPTTTTTCQTLFTNTSVPISGMKPTDTLQAAVQMALYPYQNVATLYNLAPPASPFVGLSTAPTDFTLAVSYTAPTLGLSIAGSATSGSSTSIDIDINGRVWFPTNKASAHGIAYFDPTTATFNGPFGTGVTTPQYVAIDAQGTPVAFVSDLSSNQVVGVSTLAPSAGGVYTYTVTGGTSTGPLAVTSNAATVNALLIAGATSSGFNLYELDRDQGARTVATQLAPYTYMPSGIAPYTRSSPAAYFEAEAATSGSSTACLLEGSYNDGAPGDTTDQIFASSASPCISGGVIQTTQGTNESLAVASTQNKFCSYNSGTCFTAPVATNLPQGLAIDGDRNIWVANSGNNSVSTFFYAGGSNYTATSTVPYTHASMTKPYGLAIDRSGNVWVSNAGCVNNSSTACTPGSFVLSELIGAAAPTLTPLVIQNTYFPANGTRPQLTPADGQQFTSRHGHILPAPAPAAH